MPQWLEFMLLAGLMWTMMVRIIGADPFGDDYYNKPVERRKTMKDKNLYNWEVYTSKRFIVKGNLGLKITIQDLQENMEYIVQYSDLARFRDYWGKISHNNRDRYVRIYITTRKGIPIIKQVA